MEEAMGKVEGEETATSELYSLKQADESLRSELKTAYEKIAGLEKTIADKESEIESVKKSLEEFAKIIDEKEQSLVEAVVAYKELAAQANPGLVAEMIKGNTIEEIKESVAAARALVERVKQEIVVENSLVKVPAGAPSRTVPDLSTLSPREKIRYAMEGG